MSFIKKAGRWVADFFEIGLPGALFLLMFLAFVFNIIMRYIVRDSQIWANEFISNSFMVIGLLSACAAHRYEDLVVFDLLYTKMGGKGQNVLRIISNALIFIGMAVTIPFAVKYVFSLHSVTYEMKIPHQIIFASMPILFISAMFRSGYRLVLDILTLKGKTYSQRYNLDEDKETLI